MRCIFFFFNDTATTEIYTLSLHDALPISRTTSKIRFTALVRRPSCPCSCTKRELITGDRVTATIDRKSTRLNSSHANISYAVFCLKKKNKQQNVTATDVTWPVHTKVTHTQ